MSKHAFIIVITLTLALGCGDDDAATGAASSGGDAGATAASGSGGDATGSTASGGNSVGVGGNGVGGSASTGQGGATSSSSGSGGFAGDGFAVDHTSVALFEQIPPQYLQAARELNMLFSDRSVGQNINEALNCLTATSWVQAPASCRRDYTDSQWSWKTFGQIDLDNNAVPARISFTPDPVIYDRSNWIFEFRGGSWSELTEDFVTSLAPQYVATTDVLSYQFSYLNVTDNDDIASSTQGFFANNSNTYDVHDLEAFIAQHPSKVFIFWTTSLARGIGTQVSTDFNDQMRSYAQQHGKILFDVADIESHTDTGVPCYDNRDGVEYCQNQNCENHADDGLALPAICQDYTTETEGGHLGSVSGAKILIAKAFWVLMARIAGWSP